MLECLPVAGVGVGVSSSPPSRYSRSPPADPDMRPAGPRGAPLGPRGPPGRLGSSGSLSRSSRSHTFNKHTGYRDAL